VYSAREQVQQNTEMRKRLDKWDNDFRLEKYGELCRYDETRHL